MAQPKFTLSKYIKLADCSERYCKAAFYSNGKIKPTRCIIGGKEEEHPEGSYFLYHKKSWIPVGADALDAQRRRNAQLDNYELNRLRGTTPAQSPTTAAIFGKTPLKQGTSISQTLKHVVQTRRPSARIAVPSTHSLKIAPRATWKMQQSKT